MTCNALYFAGNRGQSSALRGGLLKIRHSAGRAGRLLVAGRRGESDHASESVLSSSAGRSELRRELRWDLPLQVRRNFAKNIFPIWQTNNIIYTPLLLINRNDYMYKICTSAFGS